MNIKSGFKSAKRVESILEVTFVLPQIILYFGFTILPFFIAIPLLMTDKVNFSDMQYNFIGLKNFVSIFKEPLLSQIIPPLRRTAVFAVINYSLVFLLGFSLALFMYEIKSRLRNVFFSIIFMPYVVSGLGIGMLLIMLFSKDTGSVNILLSHMGIIKHKIDVINEGVAVIAIPLVTGWRNAGFNMALFLSGLLTIPRDTIDSSMVDGASYLRRLRHIYFPQIIPNISMITIICMIDSFGAFDIPVGFGALRGIRSAEFFSILIYRLGFGVGSAQSGTLAQSVTLSLTVYLPLIIVAFILVRMQKKFQY